MTVLLKLLIAHLLGDFILQPTVWVEKKEQLKHRAPELYYHVLIHAGLVFLLVWDWRPALAILIGHYLIDLLKLHSQGEENRRSWFMIDQVLHLMLILMVASIMGDLQWPSTVLDTESILALICALLFLTYPCSMLIKVFISRWAPEPEENAKDSLQDAGMYIGILERLFVFFFIYTGHWEGVGFLIAAKSVFRFGDLNDSTDRKLTEYVLIGTLSSFGLAMLVGSGALYLG